MLRADMDALPIKKETNLSYASRYYSSDTGYWLLMLLKSACPGATGSGYATVFTAYEFLTFHYCILTNQVWARGLGQG